jgi:hypothetical protein
VFPHKILITTAAWHGHCSLPRSKPAANSQQPQVKVNVLNVCAPSADEQKELSSALAKVPAKPVFGTDYEVARGRSTLDPNTPIPGMGPYLRCGRGGRLGEDSARVSQRRPVQQCPILVQRGFEEYGGDAGAARARSQNDLMQVSVEDSASAVASATAMLSTSTPVSRVKLERFGKSSVALARCGREKRKSNDGSERTNRSSAPPRRLWSAIATLWARAKWCPRNWLG